MMAMTTTALDASDRRPTDRRPMTWPDFAAAVGELLEDPRWVAQMAVNVAREPVEVRNLLRMLGDLGEGLRDLAARPDVPDGERAAVLAGCDTLDRAIARVGAVLEDA